MNYIWIEIQKKAVNVIVPTILYLLYSYIDTLANIANKNEDKVKDVTNSQKLLSSKDYKTGSSV